MEKFKKVEDLYSKLDDAIDQYTNEIINKKEFDEIIEELNKNEFGIKIDKNLVTDNRESFNENGLVSYPFEDDIYNSYNDY